MIHYLKAVFKVGLEIIIGYFSWMRKYAKNAKQYSIEERYNKLRTLIRHALHALCCTNEVVGKENLPNVPFCLVSNHLCAFDPLAYISVIEKPISVVAKKEVLKMPFIGKCLTDIDGVFLERENLKQSLRIMMQVEEDLKQGNKSWLIFPEGTRNRDDMRVLLPFHHGTFRPAYKAGVPIVPAVIFGLQRAVKMKPLYKRYPLYIEFGKPLYKEDYQNMSTEEISVYMQNEVQKMLTYHARKIDLEKMVEYNAHKYPIKVSK